MGSYNEHQKLINQLVNHIEDRYESVKTNILYHDGAPYDRNEDGEVDVAAWREGLLDIFEVKSNGNKNKAKEQLKKEKEYFSQIFPKVRTFYFDQNYNLEKIGDL